MSRTATGLWLWRLYMGLVGLFIALPIFIVAAVSLNAARTLVFPPQGLSLRWYAAIFVDPEWRAALIASVSVAALSAAVAVAIAFPLAWFLWRRKSRVGELFRTLGMAPFILPPVITALGFLALWATSGVYGQTWTVVIAHGIFFTTLPLVTLSIGFSSIDASLTEAASTMGANERTVLRTLVLPLVRPYLFSGYAFAFVLSLNEYIVAYMSVGFTLETLPIKIFNALRYGYTPVMASVSVFFVLAAALIFGLIARYGDLPKLLGAWSPKEN